MICLGSGQKPLKILFSYGDVLSLFIFVKRHKLKRLSTEIDGATESSMLLLKKKNQQIVQIFSQGLTKPFAFTNKVLWIFRELHLSLLKYAYKDFWAGMSDYQNVEIFD